MEKSDVEVKQHPLIPGIEEFRKFKEQLEHNDMILQHTPEFITAKSLNSLRLSTKTINDILLALINDSLRRADLFLPKQKQ